MKKDPKISKAVRSAAASPTFRGSRRKAGAVAIGRGEIAALDRAMMLLLALAETAQPTPLNEAAHRTGLSKATAFRILSTLVSEGLVVQDQMTASYRLGVAPLKLATAVREGLPVLTAARQAMRAVTEALNETTVLSVIDGDHRVNIDATECSNAISSSRRLGEPRPLHVGAASRVLLAALPDDEIEAYLARCGLASEAKPGKRGKPGKVADAAKAKTAIADAEQLRAEIRHIRHSGFASSLAEISPDSHAVAAAIRGPDGRPAAAIYVAIPRGRFSNTLERKSRRALAEAVRQIERALAG